MAKNPNNIITYVNWRGDLSLSQDKFNEVDGLIFAEISFINIKKYVENNDNLSIHDAYTAFFNDNPLDTYKFGVIVPAVIGELGFAMKDAKRYKDLIISDFEENFDESKREQFAAVTIHLNDQTMVISFQGTDDTLIGWEEDVKMAENFPIYAQESGVRYLSFVANKYPNKKIILCGHSKGGNLAMYTGMFAPKDIDERIIKILNYDGPGFEKKNIPDEVYNNVKSRLKTFLPSRSVIGMIFNQYGKIYPLISTYKGIFQHDGFSWTVKGRKFVYAEEIDEDSKNFSNELNRIVGSMTILERMRFCDSLKAFINELGYKTLLEVKESKNMIKVLNATRCFKKEDREVAFKLVKAGIKYKVL